MEPIIVTMVTGEQVICELKEVTEGEGENKKGVCLLMIHPYILSLIDDGESPEDMRVKFSKWCPYSIDTQYKIPYNSIIAMGEPDPNLKQAFINKVELLQNDTAN